MIKLMQINDPRVGVVDNNDIYYDEPYDETDYLPTVSGIRLRTTRKVCAARMLSQGNNMFFNWYLKNVQL